MKYSVVKVDSNVGTETDVNMSNVFQLEQGWNMVRDGEILTLVHEGTKDKQGKPAIAGTGERWEMHFSRVVYAKCLSAESAK